MAYFLKKSNLKKGVYLQIYESFYNPERRQTCHRSYKALGYVNDLIRLLSPACNSRKAAGEKIYRSVSAY